LLAVTSVSLAVWVHQQQLNKHKNPPCSFASVKYTPRWPQVAAVLAESAKTCSLPAAQHDSVSHFLPDGKNRPQWTINWLTTASKTPLPLPRGPKQSQVLGLGVFAPPVGWQWELE